MKKPFKRLTVSSLYARFCYDHAIALTFRSSHGQMVAPNRTVQIQVVTCDNCDDALTYEPREKVDVFHQFLDRGDIGFYAYLAGQFVHRSWVTLGPKTVSRWKRYAPLELKKGEAYIHWCETVPSARGLGVYPTVLNHIVGVLSDRAREFYISTTGDNAASRNGIKKAGFSLISGCEVTAFLGLGVVRPLGKETLSEYR